MMENAGAFHQKPSRSSTGGSGWSRSRRYVAISSARIGEVSADKSGDAT
ncbi:hypothetical protein FsymDg_0546 [Candidatus Protofrankia datiscae]|uniref:Uncharacterized protein n=1 Tax=Candidatus Protofrankia datiscae TaxID=2716812 RepID=F8B1N9_9ACTN|nr:hypothetical protein FsymDg_0546 [Candidatus Protofrankia datiscae]